MDHGTVIALVVVLGEDRPIGGDFVFMPGDCQQPCWLVRRDKPGEGGKRLGERFGLGAAVDEHKPMPLPHR